MKLGGVFMFLTEEERMLIDLVRKPGGYEKAIRLLEEIEKLDASSQAKHENE